MKLVKTMVIACLVAILAPPVAWSATGGTGIKGTDHDFTGSASTPIGLCTFCHTPHKALSTPLLWNHTLSVNNFQWDVPSTTAGTTYPSFAGDTYQGSTAKCLSCHDGSVAVGDIAWFNEGKPGAPLDNTKHGQGDNMNVGFGGAMKGNHPVAMPYPYQNQKNTYNGVTTGDAIALGEWQADPQTLNIALYNDDGAGNISKGAVAAKTGIECSSCHDPHNKASVEDLFLRGKLTGSDTSYICLECHIK